MPDRTSANHPSGNLAVRAGKRKGATQDSPTPARQPGRAPERLHIDGNWEQAVGNALRRGKPPAPEPKTRPAKKGRRPE
jgi:hypothetical protein